uniref:Uncharacterized protein n=1 Tax=Picea glauca TaxID=3330 RepID=A0A101M0B7_PICGL|nr:hypothetical protein ABT39_MTgene4642 [Picea glauca]QHR90793.1 hypothetical protein Q903MT_gene4819 [Picea sitchensis]
MMSSSNALFSTGVFKKGTDSSKYTSRRMITFFGSYHFDPLVIVGYPMNISFSLFPQPLTT